MKISIAMASYNGAEYISEQLESFLRQTRLPDEVVITDDCSDDGTVKIIEEFAQSAPFDVRLYLNDHNLGYAGNFNKSLSLTTGDLVFLCDQDDVWFPEKIEIMERFSQEKEDFLIYMNDARLTNMSLTPSKYTKLNQIKMAGLPHSSFVMGCCCAIRRELLDIFLPIPSKLKAHDNWLVGIADDLGLKAINPVVLQYYRRHENNSSNIYENRLKKNTRCGLLLEKFKRSFFKDEASEFRFKVEQKKIFLFGIRSIETDVKSFSNCRVLNKESVLLIIDKRKQDLDYSEFRLLIRSSKLITRFALTSKRIFKERSSYRLRHIVRDLIG